MADFEKASTNALKYHFPNIEVKGCWFHFRQAIHRRAVKIGLKKDMEKDEYTKFMNSLGAMALIPIEQINEAFEFITSFMPNDPKCTELYEYFRDQWMKSKPNIKYIYYL